MVIGHISSYIMLTSQKCLFKEKGVTVHVEPWKSVDLTWTCIRWRARMPQQWAGLTLSEKQSCGLLPSWLWHQQYITTIQNLNYSFRNNSIKCLTFILLKLENWWQKVIMKDKMNNVRLNNWCTQWQWYWLTSKLSTQLQWRLHYLRKSRDHHNMRGNFN